MSYDKKLWAQVLNDLRKDKVRATEIQKMEIIIEIEIIISEIKIIITMIGIVMDIIMIETIVTETVLDSIEIEEMDLIIEIIMTSNHLIETTIINSVAEDL